MCGLSIKLVEAESQSLLKSSVWATVLLDYKPSPRRSITSPRSMGCFQPLSLQLFLFRFFLSYIPRQSILGSPKKDLRRLKGPRNKWGTDPGLPWALLLFQTPKEEQGHITEIPSLWTLLSWVCSSIKRFKNLSWALNLRFFEGLYLWNMRRLNKSIYFNQDVQINI